MNNWITLKLHNWIDDGSEKLIFPLWAFASSYSKGGVWASEANTDGCPSKCLLSFFCHEYVAAQQLGGRVTKFLPMECEWKRCVHSVLELLKQQTCLLHPFFSPFCPTGNDSHPSSNTHAMRVPRKKPELSSQPGQLLAWTELNYLPKKKNEPLYFGVSLLQQFNIPLMNTTR